MKKNSRDSLYEFTNGFRRSLLFLNESMEMIWYEIMLYSDSNWIVIARIGFGHYFVDRTIRLDFGLPRRWCRRWWVGDRMNYDGRIENIFCFLVLVFVVLVVVLISLIQFRGFVIIKSGKREFRDIGDIGIWFEQFFTSNPICLEFALALDSNHTTKINWNFGSLRLE